jgi:hypothetical protein
MKQRNTNKRHTDLPALTYMHTIQYNTQAHSLHTALPAAAAAAASTTHNAQGTRHKERSSGACAADDHRALLHGHAMILHDSTRAASENKRENEYSPFPQRGHSYLAGM